MSVEIIGIDHIYVAVSDLARSERFYDAVMSVLGFRKNKFVNEGDEHIQYYNRHFGFVLRPAHNVQASHDPLSPGLHHFCLRCEDSASIRLPGGSVSWESPVPLLSFTRSTRRIITRFSFLILTGFVLRSLIIVRNDANDLRNGTALESSRWRAITDQV